MRTVASIMVICALTSAGCQTRLKWNATATIEPGQIKVFDIDAPRYDQQVTVDFTADNEISIYVCLQEDQQKVQDALDMGKVPTAGILGSKEKASNGSLEVAVPARLKPCVLISNVKKTTTVTLKITGK